jgi:hypothetical protein
MDETNSETKNNDDDDAKQGGAEAVPDPTGIPEGESSAEYGGQDAGAKPGEKPVTGLPED